jgi:nitrogen fixation/metabolism regulation signal transduction histidine kinase
VFAVGMLGLFLVVTGGFLLGNYISRPIAEIEEGLLLVINGQQDLRFELEHEELGGLTSRINSLLNSLLGVKEGDDQG